MAFEGFSYNFNDRIPVIFGKGFLAFGVNVDADFAVEVVDQDGRPIEDALVRHIDLSGSEPEFTGILSPDGRYYFRGFASGQERIIVSRECYTDFEISTGSAFTGLITATLVLNIDVVILWAPVSNSLKFVNDNEPSFLEAIEYRDFDYPNFQGAECYTQKVEQDEVRPIQWHSRYPSHTIELFERDLTTVAATFAEEEVLTGVTKIGVPYSIFESSIDFAGIPEGIYYLRITSDTGGFTIQTEPIELRAEHIGSIGVTFKNSENTPDNYFAEGFEINLRIEGQIWKRLPGTTRAFFRDSFGKPQVLGQRQQRKNRLDIYNIPPYLLEQLSYLFSLSSVTIGGQEYVSEEGLEEPQYRARYRLTNTTIVLESVNNYDQVLSIPEECNL